MRTSYHVHSIFSDGSTDIKTLVEAANLQQLDELGISDHYTVMPDGKVCPWSMELDRIGEYLAAIYEASANARPGLRILRGLEADFFPECCEALKERIAPYDLDYLIGSIHFIDAFPVDDGAENWEKLSVEERNDMIREYWSRITGLAKSGVYSFIGHLDLYKKYGYGPTIDIRSDINEALDAIAASGMAVELNTAGLYVPAKEIYPSPDILRECRRREIPVLINADAHTPENLTRSYQEARELLLEVHYDPSNLWRPDS